MELKVDSQKTADTNTEWTIPRPCKREYIWHESLDLANMDCESNPAHRVYRLTERTIDKQGVDLLLPEYVLEGCSSKTWITWMSTFCSSKWVEKD